MNRKANAELDEPVTADDTSYYREARNWDGSRVLMLERAERRAWLVAAGSLFVALAAIVALVLLMPLKQAVPFLVYVDRFSGETQVREAMNARVEFSDIFDKHWLMQYVRARERYDWNLLQADYDFTLALTAPAVAREYKRQFDGPQAVYKVLGRNQEWVVSIVSISLAPHAPGTAGVGTVRFERSLRNLENGVVNGETQHFVATVGYSYQPSTFTSEKTLIMNPLGFTVTSYHVDPELTIETLPQTAPGLPPASGAAITGGTR